MTQWRYTFPTRPNLFPLRTLIHALTVAALLAGLIPPPAVTGLINSLLPTALAEPATELAETLLPQPDTALAAAGEITGTVFRDYAADAVKDATDAGLVNIVVTAYDANGNSAATTTDASGAYTLTASSGAPGALSGQVRIEFTLPTDGSLDFLEPTVAGTGSATTVQFADIDAGANGVNAGFYNPAQYYGSDPDLATPRYLNQSVSGDVLISWDYDNRGSNEDSGWVSPTNEARNNEIGSTWGLAYRRVSDELFAAAFIKRHTSMPDHDANNEGDTGAIYAISADGNSTNNGAQPWLDLNGSMDSNGNTIDTGHIGDRKSVV